MVRMENPAIWPAFLDVRPNDFDYVNNTFPFFVFFGRPTGPGEKYVLCGDRPDAPGYVVKKAQRNLVP